MKLAIRRRVISYNPAEGCETLPPVRHTKADFFKDFSIVERIAEEADETWAGLGYGLFIRLQGTLGLRFGEAAALRRRSVDPARSYAARIAPSSRAFSSEEISPSRLETSVWTNSA